VLVLVEVIMMVVVADDGAGDNDMMEKSRLFQSGLIFTQPLPASSLEGFF
jgi:hypothetical protein